MADRPQVVHPLADALGIVIRRERLARELTISTLADRANLSYGYLGGIERGVREPSISVVARIADALRQRTNELIAKAEAERWRSRRLRRA